MSEQQGDKGILGKFKSLRVGGVVPVPVDLLRPTQPDDGRKSNSTQPIEGHLGEDGEAIDVIHGNHRFWDIRRRGDGKRRVQVRKVQDPYEGHIKSSSDSSGSGGVEEE